MINQLITILQPALLLLGRSNEISSVTEEVKADLAIIKEFLEEALVKLDGMR